MFVSKIGATLALMARQALSKYVTRATPQCIFLMQVATVALIIDGVDTGTQADKHMSSGSQVIRSANTY